MESKHRDREKRYVLVEFPYPSGTGLHMGHAFTFTGGDVYARALRMQGYEVLFPMGWDSFGLPTENYALRTGRKPQDVTRENTRLFERQMRRMRFSFDWDRMVDTSDPAYYRFTQWIFLKLVEHGLAYKTEMPINWCPSCRVGLANEEVIEGRCERCGSDTTRRRISQWVVRITDYADRLLEGLVETEFQPSVKAAQVNWIGRSEGASVQFPIVGSSVGGNSIEVFTTRPDTIWGATFLVVAPEHPIVVEVIERCRSTDPATAARLASYTSAAAGKSDLERTAMQSEKSGVELGLAARNPATGEHIPVWVSDFVVAGYGSDAVMGVPAHDSRDHEFALRFGLPIVPVVEPPDGWNFREAAYEALDGVVIAPGPVSGLTPSAAVDAATRWLESVGAGTRSVSYHLRDWIFSRQHYWGEPIPMINCRSCGWVPVPEEELPVVLPDVDRYEPTDTGESPLAAVEEWVATTCPRCGGAARRETDTMPNWAGSDWYFLRYCDPKNSDAIAAMDALKRWLPVDVYIGGDEHNTLHLLYSRFIFQFLHDIGVVPKECREPYRKRISHGVILGSDGKRMSKSRGNGLTPDEYLDRYGADALRMYLMFMGPFEATLSWDDSAVRGVRRFLRRFGRLVADGVASNAGLHMDPSPTHQAPNDASPTRRADNSTPADPSSGNRSLDEVNRAVEGVTRDIAAFRFNTAVAALMETVNSLREISRNGQGVSTEALAVLSRLLAPFAPDAAEDAWQTLIAAGAAEPGTSVHTQPWPEHDPRLSAEATMTIPIQVNGKLRGTLQVTPDTPAATVEELARSAGTVSKHLGEKPIRRVVHVPGKLVNFVV